MMTQLTCACGQTTLTLTGPPIIAVDCCCTSCRTAGARLQTLPGAPISLGPQGQTRLVLHRKDRLTPPAPEAMAAFRLTPNSRTRRVIAPCCHTPLFLEFQGGHWISVYGSLWPAGTAPKAQMRIMTRDLPDPDVLPADIPNAGSYPAGFLRKLLTAWVLMGFRVPKIEVAGKVSA